MEDAIVKNPEKYIEKGLHLIKRQYRIGSYIFDLLFEDRHGAKLIVELQRGTLDRNHTYKILDYYDEYKSQNPDQFVELMIIANKITRERRERLFSYGIAFKEIPESEFPENKTEKSDESILDSVKKHEKKMDKLEKQDSNEKKSNKEALQKKRRELAEKHIKDKVQKEIFLTKANLFTQWANYIAALILTKEGKIEFTASDIKDKLKVILGNLYNEPGARESGLLTADIEINSNHHKGFPSIKRTNNGYKFVGFPINTNLD